MYNLINMSISQINFKQGDIVILNNKVQSDNLDSNVRSRYTKVGNSITNELSSHIDAVNNFNAKFIEFLNKDKDNMYFRDFEIIKSDNTDICGLIIERYRYRRCKGYFMIQKSNIGTRFLIYLHNYIYHSAECFGTSLDYIINSPEELKRLLKAGMETLKKFNENDRYRKFVEFFSGTFNPEEITFGL